MLIPSAAQGWAETITVKGKAIESPTTKGYAISISRIDPVPEVSLYSLIDKLPLALRETVAESREDNQQWHDQFPSIKNVIASQGSVFFVREVSAQATVDVDDRAELADANYPPQIRLHNWSVAGDAPECRHPIDILVDHAMAATNTCTIEAACAMLEIAANAKALRVVACSSDYRAGKESVRSPLAGWPIVDTEVLLSAIKTPVSPKDLVIDATGNYAVFKPDFEVAFPRMPENEEEDEAQNGDDEVERLSPLLYVSTTVLSPVNGSSRVKTPDFMLCGPDIDLGKALFVRFVHPRFPQQCILMSAYVNLGRPQIVMPGTCFYSFLFCRRILILPNRSRPRHQHTHRRVRCSGVGALGRAEASAMDAAGRQRGPVCGQGPGGAAGNHSSSRRRDGLRRQLGRRGRGERGASRQRGVVQQQEGEEAQEQQVDQGRFF